MTLNASPKATPTQPIVFIGAYTSSTSTQGITTCRLDMVTGCLEVIGATKVENASFLTLDPSMKRLYAVNEQMNVGDQPGGGVSAFALDRSTAALTYLNQRYSLGGLPCYVSVDQTNKYALVANYMQGNVIMLPINADGSLAPVCDMVQHPGVGVSPKRQQGPRAHSIVVDPTNQYVFVADLGLDKVFTYRLDLIHGKLIHHAEFTTRPGSGPRHLIFHPNGRFVYLLHELDGTLTALAYHAENGTLEELQHVPLLPADFTGYNTSAEVRISPDGRFVYGSNRGHDSITAYAIDVSNGHLTFVDRVSSGGKTPRNFCIDPTGTYAIVANQDSDNVVTFRRDFQTGKLTQTAEVLNVSMPVYVRIYDL